MRVPSLLTLVLSPSLGLSDFSLPQSAEWTLSEGDPLHSYVELEVGAEGETVTFTSGFEGRVSVWAESEDFDPALSVRIGDALPPREDDDSGGGTTAWLRLETVPGQSLTLTVSPETPAGGRAVVHVIEAPDSSEARAAISVAEARLEEFEQLIAADQPERARQLVSEIVDQLILASSAHTSDHLNETLWTVAFAAFDSYQLHAAHRAFLRFHESRSRLLPDEHPSILAVKENLALTHRAIGDLNEALVLQKFVHRIRSRDFAVNHELRIAAKLNLAVIHIELGQFGDALPLMEEVHRAYSETRPNDHPDLQMSRNNLAGIYSHFGDSKRAGELMEEVHSIEAQELAPDDPVLLQTKHNLAYHYEALGDLHRAHELKRDVYEALSAVLPQDNHVLLTTKFTFAQSLFFIGDAGRAAFLQEELLGSVMDLYDDEHPFVLTTEASLALSYLALGDLFSASALLESVYATRSRTPNSGDWALLNTKANLALVRASLGDADRALALQREVVNGYMSSLPPNDRRVIGAKLAFSISLYRAGQYRQALEIQEEVLTLRGHLDDDHPDLLSAKVGVAATLSALGDLERARELQEEVLESRSTGLTPDHTRILASKEALAVTLMRLGDLRGALQLFREVDNRRAIALYPEHPKLLYAKQSIASTLLMLGDREALAEAVRDYLNTQVAVIRGIRGQSTRLAREAALRVLGHLELALHWCESAASSQGEELERDAFRVLIATRMVSSANARDMQQIRRDPELRQRADRLQLLGSEAAALAHEAFTIEGAAARSVEAIGPRLVRIAEERDQLQRELRSDLGARSLLDDVPGIKNLAGRLRPDEALVCYLRYTRFVEKEREESLEPVDSLLAFILTPDQRIERLELGPIAGIEALAQQWLSSVGSPTSEPRGLGAERATRSGDVIAAGAALRASLLDPIFSRAPEVRTCHVVLDDLLYLIPLDALPRGAGLVGDDLKLRFMTSVAPLLSSEIGDDEIKKLVVLGGIDYDGELEGEATSPALAATSPVLRDSKSGTLFGSLPGAAKEASSISALFASSLEGEIIELQGLEASKSRLLDAAPQARYLHLATHGWFTPATEAISMMDSRARDGTQPDGLDRLYEQVDEALVGYLPETLCGIALAGANRGKTARERARGVLTAEELATLDLSNCELAVLSACETNVGLRRAGQGIQSLQAALHAAGARRAIASLWSVDDEATRKLFEAFYTKLWKEGLDAHSALWESKMKLRNDGHPIRDWAGWILTGGATD